VKSENLFTADAKNSKIINTLKAFTTEDTEEHRGKPFFWF